jgi:shikimate kinase
MKIFLIGLPGSGKTTLGNELAVLLSERFIDLDVEITQKENLSIKEIFAAKGEEQFRVLERNMLREIASNTESFVMSTGGGAPVFHNNMQFMNDHGTTIFLNTSVEIIASRLTPTDLSTRPLFFGTNDTTGRLRELLASRLSFYKVAKLIVDHTASAAEIVTRLPKT